MPYVDYTVVFIARMEQDRTRRLEHMHACQLVQSSLTHSPSASVLYNMCAARLCCCTPHTFAVLRRCQMLYVSLNMRPPGR